MERKIPITTYKSETKSKIIDITTKLFALKGYHSVSMREIAADVDISISSLYNHYESKETIMAEILSQFEDDYKHYFDWLSSQNAKANSLDEFMDNMFNKEFIEMLDPQNVLRMSFILKEQHEFESVRKRVFELFHEFSISKLKADFDGLIDRGIIPPADTKTIASLFMYSVLVGNDLRVHELSGFKPPVDCKEMYSDIRRFLTAVLTRGGSC